MSHHPQNPNIIFLIGAYERMNELFIQPFIAKTPEINVCYIQPNTLIDYQTHKVLIIKDMQEWGHELAIKFPEIEMKASEHDTKILLVATSIEQLKEFDLDTDDNPLFIALNENSEIQLVYDGKLLPVSKLTEFFEIQKSPPPPKQPSGLLKKIFMRH